MDDDKKAMKKIIIAPGKGFIDADAKERAPLPPISKEKALQMLEELVAKRVAADEFSGVVLIALKGSPILLKAWGLAHRGFAVPNRTDTRFNIGSINKIFTKVALAQLLQQGRLSLNDTLVKLLPDYPNSYADKVTVQMLVDMTSGIPDFFGPEFEACPKDRLRHNSDFLTLFAVKPLLFEPGSRREYSNGGYIVLGEVIQKVSGQDYHEYVREHIYRPARMMSSDSFEADAFIPNLAEGYTRHFDPTSELRWNMYTRPARGSAAGGGYSTAEDLMSFVIALRENRLLSPQWTDWVFDTGSGGRRGIMLGGGAPGINAVISVDFSSDDVVIVLANLDPPAAEVLLQEIKYIITAIVS